MDTPIGCYRVDPPQTTFIRPSLAPDSTHTFSVYAVDAAGNRSANSNTVSLDPRDGMGLPVWGGVGLVEGREFLVLPVADAASGLGCRRSV